MTTTHDDLTFLQSPELWPCYPLCPVKRYSHTDELGFPECGLVTCIPNPVPMVVIANLFMVKSMTHEQLAQAQKYTYESFEDLVADGWVVD